MYRTARNTPSSPKQPGGFGYSALDPAQWVEEQLENALVKFSRLKEIFRQIEAWWQTLTVMQKSSIIGAMLLTFMLLLFVDFRRADGVFHTFLAPVFRGIHAISYFPVCLVLYTLSYFGRLFNNFLVSFLWLVFELVYGIAWFFKNGAYTVVNSVILAVQSVWSSPTFSVKDLFIRLCFVLLWMVTALTYAGVVGVVVVGLHRPTYHRIRDWFRD